MTIPQPRQGASGCITAMAVAWPCNPKCSVESTQPHSRVVVKPTTKHHHTNTADTHCSLCEAKPTNTQPTCLFVEASHPTNQIQCERSMCWWHADLLMHIPPPSMPHSSPPPPPLPLFLPLPAPATPHTHSNPKGVLCVSTQPPPTNTCPTHTLHPLSAYMGRVFFTPCPITPTLPPPMHHTSQTAPLPSPPADLHAALLFLILAAAPV